MGKEEKNDSRQTRMKLPGNIRIRAVSSGRKIPGEGTALLVKNIINLSMGTKGEMYLKGKWKKRCSAGFLALLLGCSSLFTSGSFVYAAQNEQEIQNETEAEDIVVEQGQKFDPATEFTGIKLIGNC